MRRRIRGVRLSDTDILIAEIAYYGSVTTVVFIVGLYIPTIASIFAPDISAGLGDLKVALPAIGSALLALGPSLAVLSRVVGKQTAGGLGFVARASQVFGAITFRLTQILLSLLVPALLLTVVYASWRNLAIDVRTDWKWAIAAAIFAGFLYWLLVVFFQLLQAVSLFGLYQRCLSQCFDVLRQKKTGSNGDVPTGHARTSAYALPICPL